MINLFVYHTFNFNEFMGLSRKTDKLSRKILQSYKAFNPFIERILQKQFFKRLKRYSNDNK